MYMYMYMYMKCSSSEGSHISAEVWPCFVREKTHKTFILLLCLCVVTQVQACRPSALVLSGDDLPLVAASVNSSGNPSKS